MITSIRLSTGKTFGIPVFRALNSNASPQIVTRGMEVICDYEYTSNGAYLIQQNYTDSEVLEIVNMLLGTSYTTFDKTLTGYDPDFYICHSIMYSAWVYDITSDRYELVLSHAESGTTLKLPGVGWGYVVQYYNGQAKRAESYQEWPYVNYYDGTSTGQTPPYPVPNFRPGAYYSLDYYTAGSLQYGPIGGLTETEVRNNIKQYMEAHPDEDIGYDEPPMDFDNPYGIVISEPGGGDGAGEGADIEEIDKMEVPDLPSIDVNNCGFITTYYATLGQIRALANFLWSNAFDLDTFKKLFSDPMQCIIGLGIVPIQPVVTGSQTVHFGDIDSGVAMNTCAQYAQLNCGAVNIKPYIGSFLDYAPYVNISIYLPYIGIRELSADDVMNDTVSVTYNVDVLTGGCAAIVSTAKKGVLYQFNGNCITNVPLTSVNYAAAIQNAVTAVGSVASLAAGVATGAAPLTMAGVAGLANSAANVACNSKQTVQRSGNMGGSAGMLSVQTPYLIINRPKLSVPDKLNKYTGNTANMTMALNSVKGFTMIDYIHLDGIACTDAERNELLSILKEGGNILMKIKLQTNNSDRKVVTKNVTDLITLTGTLRANCSIVDPVIQVEAINNSIAATCNYATIEDFGRYYFVNDIIFTGKLYEIHMHCDVLSSFQTPLKSLSAVVSRQENKYNLYLQDGLFRTYQNPYISIVPFGTGFDGQYFVFSVSG